MSDGLSRQGPILWQGAGHRTEGKEEISPQFIRHKEYPVIFFEDMFGFDHPVQIL